MQTKNHNEMSLHTLEWPSAKRQEIKSVSKDVEKKEHLYSVSGNVNWFSHYGKEHGGFSKNLK